MENKAEKIMAVLKNELEMEIACYNRSLEVYKATRNPIKKIKNKRCLDMFGAHVAELQYVLGRISREVEDEG